MIKKLLKKRDSSNSLFDENEVKKAIADSEALNDSDSAIIIDVAGEVSLSVPQLPSKVAKDAASEDNGSNTETKVIRSVSDVVKTNESATSSNASSSINEAIKDLKKERQERRISNRQKLLALSKRHSGYLKRPEILETVYSVEEDGDNVVAQQQPQPQQEQHQPENPQEARRGSSNSAPVVILTAFRRRLDSDLTTYSDCSSADEESARLMYSETESVTCSCSQPCSRRSSCGYVCQCMQCGNGGLVGATASAPASRRSSCGSNAATNAIVGMPNVGPENTQTAFNRVMSNHRAVTKPKDVKFKRINKAKSRSLEELRGKLKYPSGSSSINEDDLEDDDEDTSGGTGNQTSTTSGNNGSRRGSQNNRLALLREAMKQQKSLSLDRESTDPGDVSTN